MWISELHDMLIQIVSAVLIPRKLREYDISRLKRFPKAMYYALMVFLKILVFVLVEGLLLAVVGLIIIMVKALL